MRIATISIGLLWLSACAPPAPDLPNASARVRAQLEEHRSAARWRPWSAEAQGRLGMVYAAYEQHQAAAELFDRARSLDADAFRWHYLAHVSYEALGRTTEAADRLRAAVERNPDYVPALIRTNTEASLRRALQLEPKSARAHFALGRLRDDAAELHRAIELFPLYGAAHFALANHYQRKGDDATAGRHRAIHSRNRATQPAEDPLLAELGELDLGPLAETRRGFVEFEKGNLDRAAASFHAALAASPASDAAHAGLIHVAFQKGEWQQGEQLYRTAIQKEPRATFSRLYYAKILEAGMRKPEALAVLREALRIQPEFGEAHLMAGLLVEDLNESSATAVGHYREAIRLGSNPREAHFLLGRRLYLDGATSEAIGHLRQTLKPLDARTPRYRQLLASALERAGQRSEAAELRKLK